MRSKKGNGLVWLLGVTGSETRKERNFRESFCSLSSYVAGLRFNGLFIRAVYISLPACWRTEQMGTYSAL